MINGSSPYAKNFPKSKISSSVFHSSTQQQPQQTSSYKRGGGGTRACALGFIQKIKIPRLSPPDLGGGMFANILPGGTFASFWLKFNQKLANVLLYAKYNILYQKYINKMMFASF